MLKRGKCPIQNTPKQLSSAVGFDGGYYIRLIPQSRNPIQISVIAPPHDRERAEALSSASKIVRCDVGHVLIHVTPQSA